MISGFKAGRAAALETRSAVLLAAARQTKGFMPDEEGLALARLAEVCTRGAGEMAGEMARERAGGSPASRSIVEIGAYCGRSTLYLASGIAAAIEAGAPDGTVILSVDHHHGSEENQSGWEHHDPGLVDPRTGRMDTLPAFRANIEAACAEDLVITLVGDSPTIAAHWQGEAGLVFIDGGHGSEPAWADYRAWAPKVGLGCFLAIHDVFPDPRDGGRPPYELYCRALESGAFEDSPSQGCGSLRVLRRVADEPPS